MVLKRQFNKPHHFYCPHLSSFFFFFFSFFFFFQAEYGIRASTVPGTGGLAEGHQLACAATETQSAHVAKQERPRTEAVQG